MVSLNILTRERVLELPCGESSTGTFITTSMWSCKLQQELDSKTT